MDFSSLTDTQLIELINRRRRQVLVLSCAYYTYNDNLVSDIEYDKRVHELMEIQDEYPWIADKCVYNDVFKNFDSCGSGYSLPMRDGWVMFKTQQLIKYRDIKK